MTLVDIANRALDLLAEDTKIISLTDAQKNAKAMNRNMTSILKRVQIITDWPELITQSELTKDATYTDGVRFAIPADNLRIKRIVGYDYDDGSPEYRLRGGFIYMPWDSSTDSKITVEYISYDDNPDNWSISLEECVVYQLAISLAPIIGKKELQTNLIQYYEQVIKPELIRMQDYQQGDEYYGNKSNYTSAFKGGGFDPAFGRVGL